MPFPKTLLALENMLLIGYWMNKKSIKILSLSSNITNKLRYHSWFGGQIQKTISGMKKNKIVL